MKAERTADSLQETWSKCTICTAAVKAWSWSIFDASASIHILLIRGKDVEKKFELESGIHRVQRVPPTESRGRRHTSTVGVVVLPYEEVNEYQINKNDFDFEFYRGGGPGGQHRNTTMTNVRVTHKETGITACANTKSQHRNRQLALSVVVSRLQKQDNKAIKKKRHKDRKKQLPNLGRGTRVRTYNFIEGIVKDERVKKKFRPEDIMKGKLEKIYEVSGKANDL